MKFQSFQNAREANDITYTALLPVAKGDIIVGGLIEGIYMPSRKFVMGVQWHPEYSYDVDENSKKLIKAFVASV